MTSDEIGKKCGAFRRDVLKVTQDAIAKETGYSRANIAAFETGRTNNAVLLCYYIGKGLNLYLDGGKS